MSNDKGNLAHVRFISAGAGSGKTYRLTTELEKALTQGRIRPGAVIGTTLRSKPPTSCTTESERG